MTQQKFERLILIVLAIVIVVRFIQAYVDLKDQRNELAGHPKPAPNFTWRDFDSNKHALKELAGKVVVVHFWASWCGPCRSEFPSLLQTAKVLEKDAVFLTITGDEDDNPARKFLAAAKDAAGVRPDNVLYGFDPMKSVIFDVFNTAAFPESIIIDPNQNMRRKLQGMQNWGDPKMIEYIRGLKHPAAIQASDQSAAQPSGQQPAPPVPQ